MHAADSEVLLGHVLLELFYSLLSVAVDEGLHDVEVGVEVDEHLDLPLLLLDCNVVLLDAFEGEVFGLDQNFGRVSHEVLR